MSTPKFLHSLVLAASGTLVSRVFGLVRDVLLAACVPKAITDLFFVAFRIPNVFRRLFGEGALTVSFVPVYQSIEKEEGKSGALQFFARFHGMLVLVLLVLLGVGYVFAPWAMAVLTPGWVSTPDRLAHATTLLRWCFPYLFFISLVACYMGVLHAHHRFWVATASPALLNIAFAMCLAVGLWLLPTPTPWMLLLIIAVWVGGVGQWLVQGVSVFRLGAPIIPKFAPHRGIGSVLLSMLPAFLGLSALQINMLVTTAFASYLGEGSVSALYYASRLVEFPLGLIAASISMVWLPRIAHEQEQLETYSHRTLFLLLPIAVATWAAAPLWVQIVFGYGAFDAHLAQSTSVALQYGALSILGGGLYRVFTAYAFSQRQSWVPAMVSLGGALLHALLCGLWLNAYGIEGIVISLGVVSLLEGLLVMGWATSMLRLVRSREFVKLVLAVLPVYGVASVASVMDGHVFVRGIAAVVLGGGVYLLILEGLKASTWREWKETLREYIVARFFSKKEEVCVSKE